MGCGVSKDAAAHAVRSGEPDCMTFDVPRRDPSSYASPACAKAFAAAAEGDAGAVRRLITMDKVPVDSRDADRRTMLEWAAARGHGDVAGILLQLGATVNVTHASGLMTPLHIAAWGSSLVVARVLLLHDASPWVEDAQGRIPAELVGMGHGASHRTSLLGLLAVDPAHPRAELHQLLTGSTTPLPERVDNAEVDASQLADPRGAELFARRFATGVVELMLAPGNPIGLWRHLLVHADMLARRLPHGPQRADIAATVSPFLGIALLRSNALIAVALAQTRMRALFNPETHHDRMVPVADIPLAVLAHCVSTTSHTSLPLDERGLRAVAESSVMDTLMHSLEYHEQEPMLVGQTVPFVALVLRVCDPARRRMLLDRHAVQERLFRLLNVYTRPRAYFEQHSDTVCRCADRQAHIEQRVRHQQWALVTVMEALLTLFTAADEDLAEMLIEGGFHDDVGVSGCRDWTMEQGQLYEPPLQQHQQQYVQQQGQGQGQWQGQHGEEGQGDGNNNDSNGNGNGTGSIGSTGVSPHSDRTMVHNVVRGMELFPHSRQVDKAAWLLLAALARSANYRLVRGAAQVLVQMESFGPRLLCGVHDEEWDCPKRVSTKNSVLIAFAITDKNTQNHAAMEVLVREHNLIGRLVTQVARFGTRGEDGSDICTQVLMILASICRNLPHLAGPAMQREVQHDNFRAIPAALQNLRKGESGKRLAAKHFETIRAVLDNTTSEAVSNLNH